MTSICYTRNKHLSSPERGQAGQETGVGAPADGVAPWANLFRPWRGCQHEDTNAADGRFQI